MNPTTLLSGLGAAVAADPGLGGANSFGRDGKPGTGDLFLSLVSGMLGDPAGTSPAADGTVAAGPTDAATDAATDGSVAVPAAVPVLTSALATALPASGLPSLLSDAVAAAPTPAGTVAASVDPAVSEAGEPGGESGDEVAAPAASTYALAALAPLVAQALQSASLPRPTAVPATRDGGGAATAPTATVTASITAPITAPNIAPDATTSAATSQVDPAADRGAGQPSARPAARTQAQQAGPDAGGQAAQAVVPASPQAATHTTRPESRDRAVDASTTTTTIVPSGATAAAAPTAPIAAAPTGQQAPASRVAEQVFPEVLRIASSGSGTGPRRVTVKLNPEALGEVRVVLTQRRGGLEVSLSAGTDAQRALAEGAPELRRLLDAVGRVDSRIVIRDLPGAGSAPATPTPLPGAGPDGSALRSDVSTDLGGNAWSGAGRHDGEPAADREATRYRTPGSTNATDGTPRATSPSRPTTTGTSGHSGLDVTI